jgi:deazaflavin-dependent oxidoreductase (nitroreductase family)
MKINDLVAWLLRSPLHRLMGKSTLLIQVTGRKTGRMVRLPVNFQREGSELWVISSRERVWWRNLKENPLAVLWIGGRQSAARAELVLDESAVSERLARLCAQEKWMARVLHVRLDAKSNPLPEDLNRLAHERLFVRLIPEG